MHDENTVTDTDLEHLRLLSLFHYITAGLTSFVGLFPILHLMIGLGMWFAPDTFHDGSGPPPQLFAIFFTTIPAILIVIMQVSAVAIAIAGRRLQQHRSHTYCLVIAGLLIISTPPIGTALGVFSIIVLMRPAVKTLFAERDKLYTRG